MPRVEPTSPTVGPPASLTTRTPRSKRYIAAAGLAYVVGSLGCSALYLAILADSVANDLWWRHFNTTGGQTYLADVFNARTLQLPSPLTTSAMEDLDLVGESAGVLKDYSGANTYVDMRPTAVRRWMLDALPLELAVTTIRRNSLYENIYTIVSYCWVDLARRFEMAHTVKRQHRCAARHRENAAVFFETLLRNVNATDLATSSMGSLINRTVFDALMSEPGGPEWVHQVVRREPTSVAAEVAHWRGRGLRYFTMQFQNRFQYGVDNSIAVANALGVAQTIKIASVPYLYRGLAIWSTPRVSPGIWNDLPVADSFKCSLVLNSNSSAVSQGIDWDDLYNGVAQDVGALSLRTHIGPLTNWDTQLLVPPAAMVQLALAFELALHRAMQSPGLHVHAMYESMEDADVAVLPPDWSRPNMSYFGGSPLCPYFTARAYPQMPFSHDASCQTQQQFAILLHRRSVLFATYTLHLRATRPGAACDTTDDHAAGDKCRDIARAAIDVLGSLEPSSAAFVAGAPQLMQDATHHIHRAAIEFMQFAQHNDANILLKQPVLSADSNDPWNWFGWICLFDWVDGTREVVNFEGDHGNMTVISGRSDYVRMAANPGEIPRNACTYVWYVAVYVTMASAVVTSAMVVCAAVAPSVHGRWTLFQYNRVFGSVWIGRPALCLRGMTAAVVLSTATASLAVDNHVSYMASAPRSFGSRMIVTGEALWLVYVLHDVLLPLTRSHAKDYAPLASAASFAAIYLLDMAAPVQLRARIQPACTVTSFRRGVECSAGGVDVGSVDRVLVIVAIQVTASIAAYGGVRLYKRHYRMDGAAGLEPSHVLIPAATESFLTSDNPTAMHLDTMACILSGLVPIGRTRLLDVTLWTVVPSDARGGFVGHRPKLPSCGGHPDTAVRPTFRKPTAARGVACLLYMTTSILGSYAFLELTKLSLGNDFCWASLDTTGQVRVTQWFNRYVDATSPALASAGFGSLASTANTTSTSTSIPSLYATSIQDEANALTSVIQSFRAMDACMVPWIMTAYCFVDFGRTWELAATRGRQNRCNAQEPHNAAVYIESFLRNVPWNGWSRCWGDELDVAFFAFLKTTSDGQHWLATTTTQSVRPNSVEDEVEYWTSRGITRYTTQWQNYKSLGVVESFSVQNAFGWRYPLTLKSSNGTFQLPVQTSFKMTWPLACDLVASNATGQSLVRGSGQLRNDSTTARLVAAGFLPSPVGPGLAIVQSTLGPFGSISMKRVACPRALRSLYDAISFEVTEALAVQSDVQRDFWAFYSTFSWRIRPTAWMDVNLCGGNFMCEPSATTRIEDGLALFFSSKATCATGLTESMFGDTGTVVAGVVAAAALDPPTAAHHDVQSTQNTILLLEKSQRLVDAAIARDVVARLRTEAAVVKAYVREVSQVKLIQFIKLPDKSTVLSQVNVFDPTEATFELFAWLYLFDWAQGIREVVAFEGDVGAINALSSSTSFVERPVNPMEVPNSLSLYTRSLLQYITYVMLCVACLVCVYIVALRGQIEATNVVTFSRVTSLVWVGRPLILLRALYAICLLSTATLTSASRPWYTVVLATGELNWMTYIVNDMLSIVTDEYTREYSILSFVLVWVASAIWEFSSPITHAVDVRRECAVEGVDFQLVCHAGTVAIDSTSRFWSLLGLVFGCCAASYVFVRISRRSCSGPKAARSSYLVYAAAHHQFQSRGWVHRDVQYLDKASAVFTGLLTCSMARTVYIFDIKSWRMHRTAAADRTDVPPHLVHAVPLVE